MIVKKNPLVWKKKSSCSEKLIVSLATCTDQKMRCIWKTFGRTRLCTCALNCSVLAVVAEEFVCGIASCEGRLLEEVELQEYVESCCAFLPYIIYNNGLINRNSNHLIICSLAGDRRNGITAVLSCQPKLKQQQNKQNKFIHSTKRLRLYSWGYNKYFSLKKIH